MIAVLSDTHSADGHELAGRARETVAAADLVVHAGDFTSEAALDAFHDASDRLHAVHGNADDPAVQDRLPAARTFEAAGLRVAVTHHQQGGEMGLSLFGRERGADLVVSGHTHSPTVAETDGCVLLNPGSHADPRGNPRRTPSCIPRTVACAANFEPATGACCESSGRRADSASGSGRPSGLYNPLRHTFPIRRRKLKNAFY